MPNTILWRKKSEHRGHPALTVSGAQKLRAHDIFHLDAPKKCYFPELHGGISPTTGTACTAMYTSRTWRFPRRSSPPISNKHEGPVFRYRVAPCEYPIARLSRVHASFDVADFLLLWIFVWKRDHCYSRMWDASCAKQIGLSWRLLVCCRCNVPLTNSSVEGTNKSGPPRSHLVRGPLDANESDSLRPSIGSPCFILAEMFALQWGVQQKLVLIGDVCSSKYVVRLCECWNLSNGGVECLEWLLICSSGRTTEY